MHTGARGRKMSCTAMGKADGNKGKGSSYRVFEHEGGRWAVLVPPWPLGVQLDEGPQERVVLVPWQVEEKKCVHRG